MPTAVARSRESAGIAAISNLTYREILRFYLPLAASWVFMAIEAPSSIAIISRLPHPTIGTDAFGIMMSIALWTESPIIDLLSTSTTLCRDRQSFALISRFVHSLLVIGVVIHVAIAFTPLFGVLMKLLNASPEVASTARSGLMLMVPWAGAIAWRRYRQGILIRYNRTRLIGIGTAIRVSTINLVGWSLFALAPLSGVQIVAIALICSVSSEALFIHFASLRVIRESLGTSAEAPGAAAGNLAIGEEEDVSALATPDVIETADGGPGPLTMSKLLAFHLPLTMTTLIVMIGSPVVAAAIDRGPNPILALASWSVAASLIWLLRTITFALPEVVITLYRDEQSAQMLRNFSLRVGLAMSAGILLVWGTRLDLWFFSHVLSAKPEIADMAHWAILFCSMLPIINSLQSYIRGMLTAHHMTVSRFTSVMVQVTVLISMLSIGVAFQWTGVLSAAIALTASMCAELCALYFFWRRGTRRA